MPRLQQMAKSQNGVAVIVVLGVLALLMVLGVAFSVSMRVERTGAANYGTAVSSRLLVGAGLARAVRDINIATTGFYPEGDFLVSRSGTAAWNTNGAGGINLSRGRARDYVPLDFQRMFDETSPRSEWIRLRPVDGMGGHVSYLVMNVSDLLDVNYVGGAVRGGGTNVSEMVLTSFMSSAEVERLVEAREDLTNSTVNVYPYFESLAEFRTLQPDLPDDLFVEFSRYLPDPDREEALYMGTTVDEIEAREADIKRAIRLELLTDPNERPRPDTLNHIFNSLLDYVDEDSEPRDLEGPNTEAVPMLNEIALVQTPPPRMSDAQFQAGLNVETWYPFTRPNPNGHRFRVEYDYTASVMVTETDATNVFSVATNVVSSSFPSSVSGGNRFRTAPTTIRLPISINVTNDPIVAASISVSNMVVLIHESNTPVDTQTNGVAFHFNMPPRPFVPPWIEINAEPPLSYQVTDPRLNWRQSDWLGYDEDTLGTTNTPTVDLWDARPRLAKAYPVHVSDLGILYSPLELGNLMIPGPGTSGQLAPWTTFRVFAEDALDRHPLPEVLSTDPDIGEVKRGLVNINTLYRDYLEPAFNGMPELYVGNDSVGTNELAAVLDLIGVERAGGGVFTNVTEFLDLDWRGDARLAEKPNAELDALAAYSMGLLGTRQQLFLVVVSATTSEEGMGVRATAQIRTHARHTALALIWRDPTPNESGRHDCFIRYFRWLDHE